MSKRGQTLLFTLMMIRRERLDNDTGTQQRVKNNILGKVFPNIQRRIYQMFDTEIWKCLYSLI